MTLWINERKGATFVSGSTNKWDEIDARLSIEAGKVVLTDEGCTLFAKLKTGNRLINNNDKSFSPDGKLIEVPFYKVSYQKDEWVDKKKTGNKITIEPSETEKFYCELFASNEVFATGFACELHLTNNTPLFNLIRNATPDTAPVLMEAIVGKLQPALDLPQEIKDAKPGASKSGGGSGNWGSKSLTPEEKLTKLTTMLGIAPVEGSLPLVQVVKFLEEGCELDRWKLATWDVILAALFNN